MNQSNIPHNQPSQSVLIDPPSKGDLAKINKRVPPLNQGEVRWGSLNNGGLAFFLLLLVATLSNCSKEPEVLESKFLVDVSVADSVDTTGDFSGFNFLVFHRLTVNDPVDTLIHLVTDSLGHAEGNIQFEKAGSYPVQISRNGRNLASLQLLLSDEDTVKFSGQFPDISATIEVDSREQRAMDAYNRVDKAFQRVALFINAGKVPEEEIADELQKQVDLYWQIFERYPGTFASKFGLEAAVNILSDLDQPQMFEKINQGFNEEYAFALAATVGKEFVASERGLEKGIAYLDSVKKLTKKEDILRVLDQAKIKLQLDSLKVEDAKTALATFEKKYEDKENYTEWFKNIRFELFELTPGEPVPTFSFFTADGEVVSNSNLLGKPYILEFTTMANSLYQQQYDEATILYQLYAPNGLQYYTLPFDPSANTIIGFFEERNRYWDVADPSSFDKKKMVENFNIHYYPTRVLVDAEGNMYRKFIGEEFDGMIPAIIETLKLN